MKCKKCGYRAKDINGMRKHYMKAHPAAMKRRRPAKAHKHRRGEGITVFGKKFFCPHCGEELN